MWPKRRTEPALTIGQLSQLDGGCGRICTDHFDRVAREWLPRELPIVTTQPAQRKRRWRFTEAVGVATWRAWSDGGPVRRCGSPPCRHSTARPCCAGVLPETMETIIDWERDGQRRLRLCITGDTLFRQEILGEIPERFAEIDAVLVHLGGTRILGVLLTMNGRDGVALSRLIRPRGIPQIRYEGYPVFRDPPVKFLLLADGLPVRTMERGQTVDLATRQAWRRDETH